MALDFGDLASRYATARIDKAMQPFNDPEAYMNNRLQQDFGVDMNGNVQPKSTTITYNDDGSQTVTTKKEVTPEAAAPTPAQPSMAALAQPGVAAAPVAQPQPQVQAVQQPTFNVGAAPAVTEQAATPEVVAQPQQVEQQAQLPAQLAQAAQTQAAPAAAPTAPVTPEAVAQPQVQLPQPGPAVQVAGPTQMPPVANAPSTAAQPNQAPAAAPAATPAPTAAPMDAAQQAVIDAHNETDPDKRRAALMQIAAQDQNSPAGKMAYRFIGEDYAKQQGYQKAVKELETATPTDLARYMTGKSKDGSWARAILLQRLGFKKAADEEIDKLGYGPKVTSSEIANNQQYTVVRNSDGSIDRAFTADGSEVGQREIAKISANLMPKQAHLLPSVHGAPVINARGEVGTIMYDPRTQSNYVQVGAERRPTTGWTTMAQNVQNVYGAAGAQAQGKAAGEGFAPTPLPAYPGGPAPAGTVPGAAVDQAAVTRAQGDLAALDREIATTKPTETNRLAILQQERAQTQQRLQQLGGQVQALPGGTVPGAVPMPAGGTVAQQRANLEVGTAAEKERVQVAGKRSESFNKYVDDTVTPQATIGDEISGLRKQQFALFNRPGVDASKIFGIANGAGQPAGDQRWTMVRDVLLGKVSEPDDKLRERAAQLGLNREEQTALSEYNNLNAQINPKTLKETAGAGSVSDAEQQANRERNVDPTKMTAVGAYNSMAQSQFKADLARYKNDWAVTSSATNTAQLERDWRKEAKKMNDVYIDMARQRIKYITDNGSTAAAVKKGYQIYPVPEYDPQSETWKKTRPLTDYER